MIDFLLHVALAMSFFTLTALADIWSWALALVA